MLPRGADGGSLAAGASGSAVLGAVAESEEPDTSQAHRTCLAGGATSRRNLRTKTLRLYRVASALPEMQRVSESLTAHLTRLPDVCVAETGNLSTCKTPFLDDYGVSLWKR